MSRSFKKNPAGGITTARSDKAYKMQEHSRARAIERATIARGDEDLLHHKDTGNPWKSEKDGKRWFGDRYPGLLRK